MIPPRSRGRSIGSSPSAQGAQGGKGPKYGLPDTAINEFVSAKTSRRDFGGYF